MAKKQKIPLRLSHSIFSYTDAQRGEVTGPRSQGSEASDTVRSLPGSSPDVLGTGFFTGMLVLTKVSQPLPLLLDAFTD